MRVLSNRTTNWAFRRRLRPLKRRWRPGLEGLEGRQLLATVTVNASQIVRSVDTQLLGVNVAWWDSNLNTSQTQQMVQAAGLNHVPASRAARAPTTSTSMPRRPTTARGPIPSMASFIASVNGAGLATLDYGSGSPQEAAALLAYLERAGRQ